MDKHAVFKLVRATDVHDLVVRVVTPWTENEDLARRALDAHRDQDPRNVYGLMSLPATAMRRRK